MTADMIATPDELAALRRDTGLDENAATLLLELATGEVQGMCRQRLVLVEDDPFSDLLGTTAAWFELPQRPVVDLTSLTIDGGDELLDGVDFKRFGARLWRRCGWAQIWTEPSILAGVYSHGYDVGDQALQPARAGVMSLAKGGYANASGVLSESIDDYRVQFAASVAEVAQAADYLRYQLRRVYGPGAALIPVGSA